MEPPTRSFAKILAPTDFSDCSRGALVRALDLARLTGGSVTILHVQVPTAYLLPSGIAVTAEIQEEIDGSVQQGLARERAAAHELDPGVTVSVLRRDGTPWEEVTNAAAGFDVIVIGTHGRTGLKHAFLGSVAERVVRRAPCPVLVVPQARNVLSRST